MDAARSSFLPVPLQAERLRIFDRIRIRTPERVSPYNICGGRHVLAPG